MPAKTLVEAISEYGKSVAAKLSSPAIKGAPEDQLRSPLEVLIGTDIAGLTGQTLPISLVGETSIAEKRIRPDYGVTLGKALVGYIEVKAPGKGADPRKFSDAHDKGQWAKLKSLPNLIYTDGSSFSLWQDGELVGKVIGLEGDIETAGAKLKAPDALLGLFSAFLSWSPIPPTTPSKLAEISARLCRLLRDEVIEQLALNHSTLVGLANDWRKLLFPEATDENFADGYAQAVTFGLLIARTRDIELVNGIERAASELKKSNSLIATALNLLTENDETHAVLRTSLDTMMRVLDQVNWSLVSKDDPDAWLYFYEHFLEVYDNKRRKQTGSYYTPPEIVNAMVRLVDEALRGPLFNRPLGLASSDVTVADPAVGTGTFLLGVLRKIAETVENDSGAGSVPGALAAAAERLVGFELQFGPFAVAQLRLIAELQELMTVGGKAPSQLPDLRLFITDTLGNPFVDDENLLQIVQPIAKSRREANKVKREDTITVVIGNPPYKEKAEGLGGWIEKGSDGGAKSIQAPMDRWRPPVEWGVSAHAKHLKNLYVYFWRWAAWKVFHSGWKDSTGLPETDAEGVVCFITVAGFLNGPGFQKMRADLRESCSEIWVIDCTPEGHQPEVATRIFQGVQQPVCIVIAARQKANDRKAQARVRYRRWSKADGKRNSRNSKQ
ncbi:MAG: N-6 DNA methylase [Devosia sp.]